MIEHDAERSPVRDRASSNTISAVSVNELERRYTQMKKAHYLIEVDGVEPILRGPFRSELRQTKAAKRIRRSQGEEGLLFWADVDHMGMLSVGPYTAGLFLSESTE